MSRRSVICKLEFRGGGGRGARRGTEWDEKTRCCGSGSGRRGRVPAGGSIPFGFGGWDGEASDALSALIRIGGQDVGLVWGSG